MEEEFSGPPVNVSFLFSSFCFIGLIYFCLIFRGFNLFISILIGIFLKNFCGKKKKKQVMVELLLGLVLCMWAALTVPGKFLSIHPHSEENRYELFSPFGLVKYCFLSNN